MRVSFHYISDPGTGAPWEPKRRGGIPDAIRIIPPHDDKFVVIPPEIRKLIDEVSDYIYAVSIQFTDAAAAAGSATPAAR